MGELTEDAAIAALLAMSEGHLHINGNLYAEGRYALVARGDSVVRINESNTKTIQLIGDIDFNYDKESSGTGANADVLVNLSNADSFWKGSATVSYGSGKPSDEEKLSVKNFQLGLSNGAQWNPTVVKETDGETTGTTQLAVNKLTFNDGIINLQTAGQTVEIQNMSGTGGTLNIATSKTNTGFETAKLTVDSIGEGSNPTLTMNFSGITADHISNAEEELGTLADQSLDVSSGQNVAQVRTVSEGNIRGAITQNVDETGATSTHQAKNVKLTDYGALNSMTSCSGETRSTTSQNVWVTSELRNPASALGLASTAVSRSGRAIPKSKWITPRSKWVLTTASTTTGLSAELSPTRIRMQTSSKDRPRATPTVLPPMRRTWPMEAHTLI